MTRSLLDTDAIVDFLKGIESAIALIRQLSEDGHQLYTCDVVVCEVHSGLSSPEQRARAQQLLRAIDYLPTSRQAAEQVGDWRGRHEAQGQQIAATDSLIAAVARAHNAQVVTGNVRDYPMPEITVLPLPRAQGSSSV